MTYTPYVVPRFGGLNLASDPQEVGAQAAVDMSNVDLDRQGRARTRDGTTVFSGALQGGVSIGHDILPVNLGADLLCTVSSVPSGPLSYLEKTTTAGATTAVGNWAGVERAMCRFGTPTSELLFISSSGNIGFGAAVTLRKYDGTTLSASTGSPRHIDVSAASNRLIQAGFANAAASPTGANGSMYTAFWSDAGAPETYSANNFVHFNPGDGYPLLGVKTWRDLTFVFKANCFYVVYSESIDASGNPVFNYRRVDLEGLLYTTSGAGNYASGLGPCMAAGSDALYYVTTRGVYRTQGGPGQLVSQAISPVFTDLASSLHINELRSISIAKGRVHVTIQCKDLSIRTFVYDPSSGDWMVWTLLAAPSRVVDWRSGATHEGDEERVYFVQADKIHYFDVAATTDAGTAIASSYTSGVYELGQPGLTTDTRWSRAWGYGTPTLSVFTDHGSSDANAGTLTLGTAPAVAHGFRQQSYSGQLFQHKLSATSGAWGVSKLQHDIAWSR